MDIEHFKALLESHRAELLADLTVSDQEAGTVELDQTRQGRLSRMDAMQRQAMAKETHRRREVELKRIAAALRRIEQDEFGYCVSCGEDIPEARLEIDPAATHCVSCAEKAGE